MAEKAIQDLSNMMRCMLANSNVPGTYWDFVIEHVLYMVDEPILEEALIVHIEAAAFIVHITNDRSPLNATQFTTPKDYISSRSRPRTHS